jgi:HEAT repeat protein
MRRVLVFSLLLVAACANRAKQSIALYEAGDYKGAASAADTGLADHPKDEGLWQMRIRAALALGDGEAIARSYTTYRASRDDDDADLLRDLAIATLGQALASPSAKLKITAIEAVAAAELHVLADQVAERMEDQDDRVVASAAVAILRGFPQAPQALAEMLRSEDPEARRIAVEGVGKKVGKLAAADLHEAANDSDPRVRRAAIKWLGVLKDKEAVELLERQLRHTDESVRAAAVSALARIGAGDLAALAQKALADKALAVRLAAIELLVAGKQINVLAQLANDPDPMIASEAAIAAHDPQLAATALERAVTAERWTIRAGAANIAVRAVGKEAAQAIARRLIEDPEPGVRLAAARLLASTGDRPAAVAVFAAMLDGDSKLSAATDLARFGDARGLKALDAAVRDLPGGPDQRAAAAAAHTTAHRITPGLVAALADPNGVVRVEAAAAIVALAK